MKREFVISRHGKDYVLYAGLLDVAHQQGLRSIKTQLLQVPAPENGQVAICLAEVTTEKGTFTGIGDAEAGNVNRMMASALIRMAETRAKARALRDAVNVGLVAIEELAESATDSGGDDGISGPAPLGARLSAAGGGLGSGAASGQPPAEILSFPGPRHAPVDARGDARGDARDEMRGRGAPAEARGEARGEARVEIRGRVAPAEMGGEAAVHGGETDVPAAGTGAGASVAEAATPARSAVPSARTPARPADSTPIPPTQTQLETIAKLARSAGRTVPTEGLTRAAASELITRLSEERYGARRTP